MVKYLLYLFTSILVLSSCNSADTEAKVEETVIDSADTSGELLVSDEAMGDIIQSFSNPVEMAALIKEVGVPFSQKYLSGTDNSDRFNTSFQRSLALGVLSADLGYLNIYSKTTVIVNYITVIKKLADGINVGQFFDFETLKRLAVNNEDLDRLMFLSVNSFNRMDRYLRDNNRNNLSTLIVTGVWIEGLYLATQVYKEKPDKRIAERIGEQKIILNDLLLILKNFETDRNFSDLIKDITEIKKAFDGVQITYEVGEPEKVEKDGFLVIVQNEKSIVKVSDDQLKKISILAEKIRNKIISM
jgi:hypothetical protein